MNREEIEDHLSSVVLGLDTNNIKLTQIKELDKQIAENEAQLNKSLIKIPFAHKKILDDMGIIKHHVPTLLEQNKQLVTKYNRKLIKAKKLSSSLQKQLKTIRSDYLRSNSEESKEKDKLANKYLKQFGQIRHP